MKAWPLRNLRALPRAAQLGLAVGVVASVLGTVHLAVVLRSTTESVRMPEYERRLASWSQSYGFATACGPSMLPDTTVILLNPLVGPGETRPDVLAVDPDASHFAYPLVPRVVSVQWDLSSAWVPRQGQADYVALWLQGPQRTAAEQSAGTQAERDIAALPFARLVCTYATERDDRGLVYAIGSGPGVADAAANNATSAPDLARPYQSLSATVRVLIALLSLLLLGATVLTVVARRLPGVLALALALPVGCLVAALELTLFSFFHIAWRLPSLLVPWIGVGLLVMVRQRRLDSPMPVVAALRWMANVRLARSELAALMILALLSGALFVLAPLGIPMQDGFSAGYFKAAAFLADGSILPFYQHAQAYFFAQPTHPPLVALTLDWMYQFTGRLDEHATLVLWPALLCSLLVTLYALLRAFLSRGVALWSVVLIMLAASDLTESAVLYGFADLPVALFILGGVGAVCMWAQRPTDSPHLLVAAGLLLAGAAWSKEEGIVSGALCLAIVLGLARHHRRVRRSRSWMAPLVFGGTYAVSLLPLFLLRLAYPAPENILHATSLTDVVFNRLPVVLPGTAARVLQHWFLPLTILLLATWHLRRRGVASPALRAVGFWVPMGVVMGQLCADVVGITFNPLEVNSEVSWAVGRLLMQVTPLVYLAAIGVGHMAITAPAPRPRRLHVLFLNTQDGLRADVSVHVTLARALDRQQVRVSVATSTYETGGDSAREAFAAISDVTVLMLDLGRPVWQQTGLRRVQALWHDARGAWTLLSLAVWCRRQGVDIVHVTERPRDALFGSLLASLAGARCVIHAHTTYYEQPRSLLNTATDWALRHADAVVGVSEFTASTFQRIARLPAQRVFAVLNALDCATLQVEPDAEVGAAMRRRVGIPVDAPVIGCVGRLMYNKDQVSLVEAFASVRRVVPNARLVIAGIPTGGAPDGGGDYLDYLERRVEKLGLKSAVVFTGLLPHAEMAGLLATFDVFVHPCIEEPFGLVVVEAMACSRPVVAVNAGGIPEIIRAGVDGLLVPPHAPAALAEAILGLLSDPVRSVQLAQSGRERVLSAFTAQIQAASMLAVYRSVQATTA